MNSPSGIIHRTQSGTPGADSVKAKAAITWVGVADGVQAEVRPCDRLFTDAQLDACGRTRRWARSLASWSEPRSNTRFG